MRRSTYTQWLTLQQSPRQVKDLKVHVEKFVVDIYTRSRALNSLAVQSSFGAMFALVLCLGLLIELSTPSSVATVDVDVRNKNNTVTSSHDHSAPIYPMRT